MVDENKILDFVAKKIKMEQESGNGGSGSGDIPEADADAITEIFVIRHKNKFRYVDEWGHWLVYNGQVWKRDVERTVFRFARDLGKEFSNRPIIKEGKNPKVKGKAQIEKDAGSLMSLIERAARAELCGIAEQWDADKWALNTPGGVIDLKTGAIRQSQPDDYMRKCTTVTPDTRKPVLWLKFLDTVTRGDKELQTYLQKLIGYALTGETKEHVLAFCYGTGANGKSVFLNTITKIFGDYAAISNTETFMQTQNDRHLTELAMLQGARLVTAQETEQGRKWAQSRVTSLTGGDPITANYMHKDHFTFTPQFKLIIAGNHKPGLTSVNEAMKRRMHMIPFTYTIPEAERDAELPLKLIEEGGCILQWAIEGCAMWQESKLEKPDAVINETKEFMSEQGNALQEFIEEACDKSSAACATSKELFDAFYTWAKDAGVRIEVASANAMTRELKALGFKQDKHNKRRPFLGLKPLADDDSGNGSTEPADYAPFEPPFEPF
jgi:putative DNA primase/helicase